MNSNPTNAQPDPAADKNREEVETIFGREVVVEFVNPNEPKQSVQVKKVSLRKLSRYAQIANQDELAEIIFYTDKEAAWVEALDDDSIDRILTAGRDLNSKSLENFIRRSKKFEDFMRQAVPAYGQLVDRLRKEAIESQLAGVFSTSSLKDTASPKLETTT